MPKFIVLQGLPASGKTTKAFELMKDNPQSWIRINNDDLRQMLWGHPHNSKDESFVTGCRNYLLTYAMEQQKNIIIDNINLNPKLLSEYRSLINEYIYQGDEDRYEYQEILIDTPIDKCILRDSLRQFPVGEQVIRRFAKMLPKKEPFKLEQDYNLPWAIICDLDGTLALFGDRPKYDRDYENDDLNTVISQIIHDHLLMHPSVKLIFVSGRKEKFRDQTNDFLVNKGRFDNYILLMRGDHDNREDSIIKRELFEEFIRGQYYIEFVIDDRDRVVKMWRDLGLTCLQVAEGNF